MSSPTEKVPERVFVETLQSFLAPVQSLLADTSVSEILINGFDTIYYEQRGTLHRAPMSFPSAQDLEGFCQNLAQYVGKSISPDTRFWKRTTPGRLAGQRCCTASITQRYYG